MCSSTGDQFAGRHILADFWGVERMGDLDFIQKTIEEILYKKTKMAFNEFEKLSNLKEKKFVVAGGVAANKKIRSMLMNLCKENNYKSIFPEIELCGDNAAMIAMVGLERFKLEEFSSLDHPAKPRWALDEKATFLKGAGVKL